MIFLILLFIVLIGGCGSEHDVDFPTPLNTPCILPVPSHSPTPVPTPTHKCHRHHDREDYEG